VPRSHSESVPRSDSESVPRSDSESVPHSDSELAHRSDSESAPRSDSAFQTDIQTWHQHLDDLNLSDVRKLLPKGSYSEKETATSMACDIYIKAKVKEKFQRKVPARRATKPLELIHSDLCGPISPQSPSGRRYYILYIDDFSHYTWVCFLHSKSSSEVCTVFRDFKNLVELEVKHHITRFRCDNGKGEYDNEAFRSILTEYSITFEPSPPYTQHKNGVSEIMIQTHNATARAMLLDCTLPPSMWAEAMTTVNYLHARSPTSSHNGMTPFEKLFGRKLEVGHLRRFGCKAFKSLPASHRSKFGTRAHPLFMLGFVHDSTTIWCFWDPHRRQVIQASNVTFLESSGLGRDASAVGLGVGVSSELNSSSEINSSGGLRLDASAVGLGLSASRKLNSSSKLNSSGGLGLDNSVVGLRLGVSYPVARG